MGDALARTPRRLKRVGHVCLEVPDVERSADFYSRVCSLVPAERDGRRTLLRAGFEHHCLSLQQGAAPGLVHLGFETLDDGDTEALWAELRGRGVPTRESAPEPGRIGLAFDFQDPEGNWVQVYRCMDRLPGVLRGGAFRLEKQGHFALRVRDFDRQVEFYRSIGLRLSDRSPRGAFLRCGTDHHALAMFPRADSAFDHHAYDVGDWGEIKLVLDWFCAQGEVPDVGPVRHGPGNNIAVYARDRDGFTIEFYCEMEQITDDEDHQREYYPAMNLWLRQNPHRAEMPAPRT
jgi:catechol 2,3-dioxygenase